MTDQQPHTIQISVTVSVTVDVAAWRDAYGPDSVADIRDQVRSSVQSAVATDGIVAAAGIVVDVVGRN